MRNHCRFFFMSLLLLGGHVSPMPLSAQKITFTHLTTEDGLSSNIVIEILQDQRGYLWFGTRGGGLVRYDGYEMTVYQHAPGDSTSLSPGSVNAVHETDDGTLWVGTDGGLSRFDPTTGTFETYQHVPGDTASLSSGSVNAVHETDDGTLWVGTDGGLSRFEPTSETFETYQHVPGDSTSLSDDRIRALHQADDGTLWVGTTDGFSRFVAASETFETYQHVEEEPTSLSPGSVTVIHETDDGTLWVGTSRGVSRFDPTTGTFKVYRHVEGDPTSLGRGYVRGVQVSDDGTLWVGTSRGLNRFDAATETFEVFQPVPGDPTSLSEAEVWALHASDDGALWIGTFGGGLNRFDPASETFETYQHVEEEPTSLSRGNVLVVHESDDGALWIGTFGGGLNRFDPVKETFSAYQHVPGDSTSLSDERVQALHTADDGTLWVGTWGGDLNRFDPVKETFSAYRHVPGDSTSLSQGRVQALHQSDDGALWVGTSGGLSCFEPTSEKLNVYRHDPGNPRSLSHNNVQVLHPADDGTLWVGTLGGLNRFDPVKETFTAYRHVPGDPTSLSDDRVRALHQADDGTLWVGTDDGLSRLEGDPVDPTSVSFTRFLADASNPIRSILEDEEGLLWLGLAIGRLVRFDPETGRTRFFGKRYGLPAGSFTKGIQSRSGTLYWGNSAGLVSLRPGRLPPPGAPPKVHLSELWLFDERLTPGPDSPLKQASWQTESLQLSHAQNDLTFGFVGLHFANPEENRYQYRLLGYDRDWRSETRQRRATYTNLPPGDYTFEVKAANSDGIWTEELVRLGVEILPPWWRTVWAYVLYGLLFVGAVFLADRVQRRRLIARERERARERELEQAREIEKAYHELRETKDRLVQQEKMASLGQLTAGIAHEIKNPLNFVNNFSSLSKELAQELQEALAAGDDQEARFIAEDLKTNAAKIEEHGQRADGIVRSMMQHARGGPGEREAVDLNALVNEYVDLAYHGKRAQTPDFTVEIAKDLSEEVGEVEVVLQEIGRVILNLVGNAFDAVYEQQKALDEAYAPTVTVTTQCGDGQVKICVEDNGPGIPEDVREKIFEPFFTTKPTGSGTGLGLSLSYDIVTQGHGGTLSVESKDRQGAAFVVTLPVDGRS